MTDDRLQVGRLGEERAVKLLKDKGYSILERNVEDGHGEIDIIAIDKGEMVFVEVRSKTGTNFGLPEETVKYRKKQKLVRNAKRYVNYNNIKKPYRIDVIGVVLNNQKKPKRIKHYKNITL